MKKLGLGVVIALLACATVFADGKTPNRKVLVKKATCTACTKANAPARQLAPMLLLPAFASRL